MRAKWIALATAALITAAAAGYVAAGHAEYIAVVVDDDPGFHTTVYTCWQTNVFQVCERMPHNLRAERLFPTRFEE